MSISGSSISLNKNFRHSSAFGSLGDMEVKKSSKKTRHPTPHPNTLQQAAQSLPQIEFEPHSKKNRSTKNMHSSRSAHNLKTYICLEQLEELAFSILNLIDDQGKGELKRLQQIWRSLPTPSTEERSIEERIKQLIERASFPCLSASFHSESSGSRALRVRPINSNSLELISSSDIFTAQDNLFRNFISHLGSRAANVRKGIPGLIIIKEAEGKADVKQLRGKIQIEKEELFQFLERFSSGAFPVLTQQNFSYAQIVDVINEQSPDQCAKPPTGSWRQRLGALLLLGKKITFFEAAARDWHGKKWHNPTRADSGLPFRREFIPLFGEEARRLDEKENGEKRVWRGISCNGKPMVWSPNFDTGSSKLHRPQDLNTLLRGYRSDHYAAVRHFAASLLETPLFEATFNSAEAKELSLDVVAELLICLDHRQISLVNLFITGADRQRMQALLQLGKREHLLHLVEQQISAIASETAQLRILLAHPHDNIPLAKVLVEKEANRHRISEVESLIGSWNLSLDGHCRSLKTLLEEAEQAYLFQRLLHAIGQSLPLDKKDKVKKKKLRSLIDKIHEEQGKVLKALLANKGSIEDLAMQWRASPKQLQFWQERLGPCSLQQFANDFQDERQSEKLDLLKDLLGNLTRVTLNTLLQWRLDRSLMEAFDRLFAQRLTELNASVTQPHSTPKALLKQFAAVKTFKKVYQWDLPKTFPTEEKLKEECQKRIQQIAANPPLQRFYCDESEEAMHCKQQLFSDSDRRSLDRWLGRGSSHESETDLQKSKREEREIEAFGAAVALQQLLKQIDFLHAKERKSLQRLLYMTQETLFMTGPSFRVLTPFAAGWPSVELLVEPYKESERHQKAIEGITLAVQSFSEEMEITTEASPWRTKSKVPFAVVRRVVQLVKSSISPFTIEEGTLLHCDALLTSQKEPQNGCWKGLKRPLYLEGGAGKFYLSLSQAFQKDLQGT